MRTRFFLAAAVLGFAGLPVQSHAATLQVNCDQPRGKLPTIRAALQALSGVVGSFGPNTIEVTGACRENVVVEGVSDLTLTAKNGASITDASGGTTPVVRIERATNVSLNGFAIRGGGGAPPFSNAAVLCITNSTCYLSGNNVQNASGSVAVTSALGAAIVLAHDVLEQTGTGLFVFSGARGEALFATIRNNVIGVNAAFGSYYTDLNTTIANNSFWGLAVNNHSAATTAGDSITGNGTGVSINVQSEVAFGPAVATINGNVTGVSIGHQSWLNLLNPAAVTVSGSGMQPDIQCWGHFSGATGIASAGSTNCPL